MSIRGYLAALIGPFLPYRPPEGDTEECRRRQVQQSSEAELVLRQLRAELKLMRRWRNDAEQGPRHAR